MSESDSLPTISSTLDEMLLVWKILCREYARPPRYIVNNNLMLAMLSDPDGTRWFLPCSNQALLPTAEVKASASTLSNLTRLYHFTLSHYGSHGFLPTLKPHLTASAPRLDNGDWLGLTVPDSHRLYSQRRTGAPPLYYSLQNITKNTFFYKVFLRYTNHLLLFNHFLSIRNGKSHISPESST